MKAIVYITLIDGRQIVTPMDTKEGARTRLLETVFNIDLGEGKVEYTYPLANVLEIIVVPEEES
jgi:hypothetical protein